EIRARSVVVGKAADRSRHGVQLALAGSFPRGHPAPRRRPGAGDRPHRQFPQDLSSIAASMDLQIEDFYKDAAGGLLMLYQAFPRKVPLYVEDLIGREEPDEFGLPSKRHQSCLGALLWLAEEGYLRFES